MGNARDNRSRTTGGGSSRDSGSSRKQTGGGRAKQQSGKPKSTQRGRGSAQAKRQGTSGAAAKGSQRRRRDLKGAAVDLPNWVVEELSRTTPNHRIGDALNALGEATAAFSDGKYPKALRHAQTAKDLAPRDATVREVLALAAYRTGDWKQALRELRTYRRLSGELTHVPVEMDVLRALSRDEEVERLWQLLNDHEARPAVMKEGRVVYGSYLIDRGDLTEARKVVAPGRMRDRPFEEDLRLWYVAARAAALDGDGDTARRLRNSILEHDPSFPGIDELETSIARLP